MHLTESVEIHELRVYLPLKVLLLHINAVQSVTAIPEIHLDARQLRVRVDALGA